jgi:DNA-directed RNA polymerase subunit RPC12/RpoP
MSVYCSGQIVVKGRSPGGGNWKRYRKVRSSRQDRRLAKQMGEDSPSKRRFFGEDSLA